MVKGTRPVSVIGNGEVKKIKRPSTSPLMNDTDFVTEAFTLLGSFIMDSLSNRWPPPLPAFL